MRYCLGCGDLIRWYQNYGTLKIPMTDTFPIDATFHIRCCKSYIMGCATAKNNPLVQEIVNDAIQTVDR